METYVGIQLVTSKTAIPIAPTCLEGQLNITISITDIPVKGITVLLILVGRVKSNVIRVPPKSVSS